MQSDNSQFRPGAGSGSRQTPTGQRIEAHTAFRFIVSLGEGEAFFTECTLPNLEVQVTEQREGGYNTGVHLLPGPVKAGRITLQRGYTRSGEILQWYMQVANGQVKAAMRNVSVTMVNAELEPVLRLDFARAYPVRWSGPSFKAGDSALAIETLELAYAEVEVQAPGAQAATPPMQPPAFTAGGGNAW